MKKRKKEKNKPVPKPRDPSSHLKVIGALATRKFTDKRTKKGRKSKHKKSLKGDVKE